MRALFPRVFTFVVLAVAFIGSHPARAWAQAQGPRPRPLAMTVEPVIATRIESLLATPNLVLVVDYYRIDMRFGPNLRVDAVIVEGVETRERLKGLRVQVRDNDNRNRQEGTSYIDIEELGTLTRGVSSMAELAAKWALDDRQATELSYTTNGGFRLAIRQSARIPRAFLSTGLVDPVITSLEVAELPTLKQAFEQAMAILISK
jgi:hypothetical protein